MNTYIYCVAPTIFVAIVTTTEKNAVELLKAWAKNRSFNLTGYTLETWFETNREMITEIHL